MMNNNRALLLGILIFLLAGGIMLYAQTNNKAGETINRESTDISKNTQSETSDIADETTHDDVHYHAGFTVFVNGEPQDYSATEFMHISPCDPNAPEDQKPDLTLVTERIHLHNAIGDVAHIHADEVTWGELFESLAVKNDIATRDVTAFDTNGVEKKDILNSIVVPYESVVIIFGENNLSESEVADALVTNEHILDTEAEIENCGK